MLKKLAIYLLTFATTFNVAGGYAIAASFKAASFSVCQLCDEPVAKDESVVKKAISDLVLVTSPLIKESDEDKVQKFGFDFDYALPAVPYFLPLLRAGPAVTYSNFLALKNGKKAPLFLLNCNFRI